MQNCYKTVMELSKGEVIDTLSFEVNSWTGAVMSLKRK